MTESSFERGKVSIVIPCYNYGKLLPETLASVDRLRSDAISDVVVVDDGSTDPETIRVIDSLSPDRYRVLRTTNRGISPARNVGIRLSRGEYILPLDSDNLLCAPYLIAGIELLANNPDIGIVYGDAEYFGERTGRWHVPEFDLASLCRENYIDNCAIFRRTMWADVGGYDELMPAWGLEDWDFWIRAAVRGWKFHHLPDIAFEYRVHSGSVSHKNTRYDQSLKEYIFGKPANQAARVIREQGAQLGSQTYRLVRAALNRARPLKRLFRSAAQEKSGIAGRTPP